MKWPVDVPVLRGAIVVLEPLAPAHLEPLFAVAQDAKIWEWWPLNPAVDRASFESWFNDALQAAADGARQHFATLDAATGRAIGSTSYCTPRPEHSGLEIGWTWLNPSAWRTGANADAKLLQLTYAFEQLGAHRVEFHTDALNERSRGALLALPAHFDGILRDWKLLASGRWRSSAVYSVLAAEWTLTQANLVRRVAAAERR